MSLLSSEIALLADLLDRELADSCVEQVIQPARGKNRIALELRGPGGTSHLLLVAESGLSRIHRVEEKPCSAQTPGPFVMLLRKEIKGGRITNVTQPGADRLVLIRFLRRGEERRLYAELTGRHANLFLTGPDDVILGSIAANKSRRRDLATGKPYIPPLPKPGAGDGESRFAGPGLEQTISSFYAEEEGRQWQEAWRQQSLAASRREVKRLERLRKALRGDLDRAEAAKQEMRLAELLKIHLHAIRKGETTAEVPDLFGDPSEQVRIPLDPSLTPVENMTRMFHRAGRYQRAYPGMVRRLEKIDHALERAREKLTQLENESAPAIEAPRTVAGPQEAGPPPRRKKQKETLPYRAFVGSNDREIRVGRNARANDELTLHHAAMDDLWLHVRSAAGSHVVVPHRGKELPPPELVVDAAHLAAHFSALRGEDKVEVIITRRRYVVKRKKSPSGEVQVTKEKVILLRLEPTRLKQLLESERKS